MIDIEDAIAMIARAAVFHQSYTLDPGRTEIAIFIREVEEADGKVHEVVFVERGKEEIWHRDASRLGAAEALIKKLAPGARRNSGCREVIKRLGGSVPDL